MIFNENYGDDGDEYKGKLEWKAISTFATNKMQNFVSLVTTENYEQFI